MSVNIYSSVFMIDSVPHSIWSKKDPREITIDFLDMIQLGYFNYQAEINYKKLRYKKHRQSAIIGLRSTYSHGLETLFSFIGALLQAPYMVPGWMLKCQNSQLYSLVKKINKNEPVETFFDFSVSWKNIGVQVFESLKLTDSEKEKEIINGFQNMWSRLSSEFINDDFIAEYNSIKHGLRLRPTENAFIAINKSLISHSAYGSDFLRYEEIKRTNQYYLTRTYQNWDPEAMLGKLLLISMSIENVISALKILNGYPATKAKFSYPINREAFTQPWNSSSQSAKISFKDLVPENLVPETSKADLIDRYRNKNFVNIEATINDSK